jgi:hypothetical protein
LNASGSTLPNFANTGAFYVNPIRTATGDTGGATGNIMVYDPNTNEITNNSSLYVNSTNNIISSNGQFITTPRTIASFSGTATLSQTDLYVMITGNSAGFSLTLPDTPLYGTRYVIRKTPTGSAISEYAFNITSNSSNIYSDTNAGVLSSFSVSTGTIMLELIYCNDYWYIINKNVDTFSETLTVATTLTAPLRSLYFVNSSGPGNTGTIYTLPNPSECQGAIVTFRRVLSYNSYTLKTATGNLMMSRVGVNTPINGIVVPTNVIPSISISSNGTYWFVLFTPN